jgi:hypothetical protein
MFDKDDVISGYQVPLAPGAYRVHLHFVESRAEDLLRFGVCLNGRSRESKSRTTPLAVEGHEIGVIERRIFELEVTDGILDVTFDCRVEAVQIAAIKIERIQSGAAPGY